MDYIDMNGTHRTATSVIESTDTKALITIGEVRPLISPGYAVIDLATTLSIYSSISRDAATAFLHRG